MAKLNVGRAFVRSRSAQGLARSMSRRWSALAVCAFAALAPLGTGAVSAGATPVSSSNRAPAGRGGASPGCGARAQTGSSTLTLGIGGHQRTVIVHVPADYSPSRDVALVLNLHGSGSTAAAQEVFSGMDATSDQGSFIVAYPQGLIPSGTGFDWNIPGVPLFGGGNAPRGSANDVAFLTQLVPVLESKYCINPREVFATGMSGGGRMASQLACDASTTFAAVAPVAGLRLPSPCPATRPVPIVAFHGTADPVDPYDGNGQAYWTYSVPTAAVRWAAQDKCAKVATTAHHSGYSLTSYQGCAGGTVVELYSVTGEGHEWPGGPTMPRSITRLLGAQSDAVNANSVMWTFFSQHPLPAQR
jgi:polyhydroxybutyrate depolymerase